LFNTWAAIEFILTPRQISENALIFPGEPNNVAYNLRISPGVSVLPNSGNADVFNDSAAGADSWSNSGYLTIQKFINTYLAELQSGTSVTVDTYLQR
jgi:hypothetical protein